jgi:hypothetical protein
MPITAEGRPVRQSIGTGTRLDVTVVFTTSEGTAAALRTAGSLAKQLNGRVTLLAPVAVSWHVPFDQPPVATEWNRRRLETLARECPADTTVRLHLCRDGWDTLRRLLRPNSLVVLGGGKHWWTREARLARKLRRLGHEVVVAER